MRQYRNAFAVSFLYKIPFVLLACLPCRGEETEADARTWTIRGTVLDDRGRPVPGAEVRCYREFQTGRLPDEKKNQTAQTDAQGRFDMRFTVGTRPDPVPEGTIYTIVAGFTPTRHLYGPDEHWLLREITRDHTGEFCAIEILKEGYSQPESDRPVVIFLSDERPPPKRLGEFSRCVTDIIVPADTPYDLKLEMVRCIRIEGRLRDTQGRGVSQCQLGFWGDANKSTAPNLNEITRILEPDGRFVFSRALAGTPRAFVATYGWSPDPIGSAFFHPEPGETYRVDLRLDETRRTLTIASLVDFAGNDVRRLRTSENIGASPFLDGAERQKALDALAAMWQKAAPMYFPKRDGIRSLEYRLKMGNRTETIHGLPKNPRDHYPRVHDLPLGIRYAAPRIFGSHWANRPEKILVNHYEKTEREIRIHVFFESVRGSKYYFWGAGFRGPSAMWTAFFENGYTVVLDAATMLPKSLEGFEYREEYYDFTELDGAGGRGFVPMRIVSRSGKTAVENRCQIVEDAIWMIEKRLDPATGEVLAQAEDVQLRFGPPETIENRPAASFPETAWEDKMEWRVENGEWRMESCASGGNIVLLFFTSPISNSPQRRLPGEGGGRVLRSSSALSLVPGKPFTIDNIRAKRKKPGLTRQRLTSVLFARLTFRLPPESLMTVQRNRITQFETTCKTTCKTSRELCSRGGDFARRFPATAGRGS